jgi:nitrite reductase/ring-hydroxylating ferredoxin subunit
VSERRVVCSVDELGPGDFRVVTSGSREVLVVCTGTRSFKAVTNACPHQGARLSEGRVERIWRAGDGRVHERDDRFAVVCPWHNFEFDLITGCPPYAPYERCRPRVARHEVVVEDDEVVVYA